MSFALRARLAASVPTSVYNPGAAGTYKPSSVTTGYAPYQTGISAYAGQFGAISNGVLTIAASNVVISQLNIPARIVVTGTNVTIQQCYIRGDATALSNDRGLIECISSSVSGCVIEDCVLAPDYPSLYLNGIRGHDFVAQRNDIYDVTDGIDVYPATAGDVLNVQILANYIHDLSGFGPDTPNNRPFTHNDCIQWAGGLNPLIRGNTFEGFLDPNVGQAQNPTYNTIYPLYNSNSVLQVNQGIGLTRGLVFDKNWVYGGGVSLNFAASGQAAGNIGFITNNQFGHDQYYQGGSASQNGQYGAGGDTTVTFKSQDSLTFSAPNASVPYSGLDPNGNNTYEDNGHTITVRLTT